MIVGEDSRAAVILQGTSQESDGKGQLRAWSVSRIAANLAAQYKSWNSPGLEAKWKFMCILIKKAKLTMCPLLKALWSVYNATLSGMLCSLYTLAIHYKYESYNNVTQHSRLLLYIPQILQLWLI